MQEDVEDSTEVKSRGKADKVGDGVAKEYYEYINRGARGVNLNGEGWDSKMLSLAF